MEPKCARANSGEPDHTTADPTQGRAPLVLTDFSDDELAAAAATGDAEAFGTLVTRLLPVLLRYLRRMVDDRQTAEDLAQDTLLDAWRGLPDFAFRSSFKTWMFSITHRKTVDFHRRRRDVPIESERFVDLAAAEPLPSDEAVRHTLIEALGVELRNLPPTSRTVWWLREVEGMSLSQIAMALRISTGSVRGHLQRSRAYLAKRLEPWRPRGAHEGAAPAGQNDPLEPDDADAQKGGRA